MKGKGRVALYYNPTMASYDLGDDHPFKADRFTRFMGILAQAGLDRDGRLDFRRPNSATRDDLLLVHPNPYIDRIFSLADKEGMVSIDTPVNHGMVDGALAVIGAALAGADDLAAGRCSTAMTFGGFHHAGASYGEGFCIFNDVAISARALLERHRQKRVLVIDTDAHQGNGTMDIFWRDPRVLFISIHQDPATLYPGRGFVDEIGEGDGEGFTVNLPMPPCSGDAQYELAMREVYLPLCAEFKPDVIIRNGGSDPLGCDELTNLAMSLRGLERMGEVVRESAERGCGRLLDLMVSGYGDGTTAGWLALFSGTSGIRMDYERFSAGNWGREPQTTDVELDANTRAVVRLLKRRLREHWHCFRGG